MGGGQVYSAILLIIEDCPLEIAREINELAAWFIEVVQGAWAMFLKHWLVFATALSGPRINACIVTGFIFNLLREKDKDIHKHIYSNIQYLTLVW
jgi:hypothetical protein